MYSFIFVGIGPEPQTYFKNWKLRSSKTHRKTLPALESCKKNWKPCYADYLEGTWALWQSNHVHRKSGHLS